MGNRRGPNLRALEYSEICGKKTSTFLLRESTTYGRLQDACVLLRKKRRGNRSERPTNHAAIRLPADAIKNRVRPRSVTYRSSNCCTCRTQVYTDKCISTRANREQCIANTRVIIHTCKHVLIHTYILYEYRRMYNDC